MKNSKDFHTIVKGFTFVFGVCLLAICYNAFLLPNNFVVGGMSGLAIIFQDLFNWDSTIFIYVSSLVLLIISYIFLGKEVSSNTLIGSILYPIMISITSPICTAILKIMDINELVVLVCLAGFLYGVANGLIYKMGFTTGGGDVIMQILSKYCKISSSRANFIYSLIIILLSGYTFGLSALIYAIIILIISSTIMNKIIEGVSNSKVFFICTEKLEEIKSLICDEFESGYTQLQTKSEFLHRKGAVLMVVVPNRYYYSFKNRILDIDSKAFFIINDCYEVGGGKRKHNIPFINSDLL